MGKFKVGDRVRVKAVAVGCYRNIEFMAEMEKTIGEVGVVEECDDRDSTYFVCFKSLESAEGEVSWWYHEEWLCYEKAVEDLYIEVAKGGIQKNICAKGVGETSVSSSKRPCICGEAYYYISSYFVPTLCIESHSAVDAMRYAAGNYFWSFEACVSACCKMRELLSKEVSLSEQK